MNSQDTKVNWRSDCCDKTMFNVKLLINEHYGFCVGCGKESLAYDPEMLKPVELDKLKQMIEVKNR